MPRKRTIVKDARTGRFTSLEEEKAHPERVVRQSVADAPRSLPDLAQSAMNALYALWVALYEVDDEEWARIVHDAREKIRAAFAVPEPEGSPDA